MLLYNCCFFIYESVWENSEFRGRPDPMRLLKHRAQHTPRNEVKADTKHDFIPWLLANIWISTAYLTASDTFQPSVILYETYAKPHGAPGWAHCCKNLRLPCATDTRAINVGHRVHFFCHTQNKGRAR